MQIAKTETLPIDENIFIGRSLGYRKRVCFATNKKNFYKRQETSLISNSRLSI